MPLFRKKPVEVEAVRLGWDTWNEMCDHAGVGLFSEGKPQGGWTDADGEFHTEGLDAGGTLGMIIPTLEGAMIAQEGDWIIKGVEGELYPCKASIFEATYEQVVTIPPIEDDDLIVAAGRPLSDGEQAHNAALERPDAGLFSSTYPDAAARVRGGE